MNRRTAQHPWTARLLLVAFFLAPMAPVLADEPKPAVPNSEIRGKVLGTDGRPAAGAVILAFHLATEEVFTVTANAKGSFRLSDLPYGYFDLAVRSADGLYVADQVANVSPTGKNVVVFRLHAFSASTQADRRAFPGPENHQLQRDPGEMSLPISVRNRFVKGWHLDPLPGRPLAGLAPAIGVFQSADGTGLPA